MSIPTGANEDIDNDPETTTKDDTEEKTEEGGDVAEEETSVTKMECRCGTAKCRKILFC